jgi:amidophosphoribosyltransferase
LIRDQGRQQLIDDVYRACKEDPLSANHVQKIYAPFTIGQINKKIVEMLRPKGMHAPVELVFQSIEGLHRACPNHPGDWYFTGEYPTPGGIRLCNEAFVNYVENVLEFRVESRSQIIAGNPLASSPSSS